MRAKTRTVLAVAMACLVAMRASASEQDFDGDKVANDKDNCPVVYNPDQSDLDGDGIGDACDPNADGDDTLDVADNCPLVPNPGQADADGDGLGDACDPDGDNDAVLDALDNCEGVWNPDQADLDADGKGDACDPDDDGDGVPDDEDTCPGVADPGQEDNDKDGPGDACDPDDDNDMIPDPADNCPFSPNPFQEDADGDGKGDACTADDDADGVPDSSDNCRAVKNPQQEDNDKDGLGDACDPDDDNDLIPDPADNCPFSPNPYQEDADGDGEGDACDTDDDNDGIPDGQDVCPSAQDPGQEDNDGDGQGDACDPDDDNDGDPDLGDCAPFDPAVSRLAEEKCNGIDDDCDGWTDEGFQDTDGDGIKDCVTKDKDGDGVPDAMDVCPSVPDPDQANTDLGEAARDSRCKPDELGDACDPDDDGDGVPDTEDNCPLVCNPVKEGKDSQDDMDGDGVGDACDGDIDGDGLSNEAEARGTAWAPGKCPYEGDFSAMMKAKVWCTRADVEDTDGDGWADGAEVFPGLYVKGWTVPTDPSWVEDYPFHQLPKGVRPHGGLGCSGEEDGGGGPALLLLVVVPALARRRRWASALIGALVALSLPSAAGAVDLFYLRPEGMGRGGWAVEGTDVLVAGKGGAHLTYQYVFSPLWLGKGGGKHAKDAGGTVMPDLIRHEHGAFLSLRLGLAEGVEATFTLPVTLDRTTSGRFTALGRHGTHDVGVGARFKVLDRKRHGIGLAGRAEFLLETGRQASATGSGGVAAGVTVTADRDFGPVYAALSAGATKYPRSRLLGVELRSLISVGALVAVRAIPRRLTVFAEFDQTVQPEKPRAFNASLLAGGVRYSLGAFEFTAGGGAGLSRAPGLPRALVFVGVGAYQPPDALADRVREEGRRE